MNTITTRIRIPVMTVLMPRQGELTERRPFAPEFPQRTYIEGYTARINASFWIDTLGVMDPTTLKDNWPTDEPRPTGAASESFGLYWTAVRRGLTAARRRSTGLRRVRRLRGARSGALRPASAPRATVRPCGGPAR